MSETAFIRRFSSRTGRLSHIFLKDRLQNASEYKRIAGYFRSSIFEVVGEEIVGIEKVRIVCNSDLDPRDIKASRLAQESILKEKWNEGTDEIDTLLHRPRYKKLYELLRSGCIEVRVCSASEAPFLHGKAGVIRQRDGSASAFIGSLNETREGWQAHYEIVWEDTSEEGIAWVEAEFEYLWERGVPLPNAVIEEIGRLSRKREVVIDEIEPEDVAPAALVEAPLYRMGEELKPWQRSFVGLFLEHRSIYGVGRFILADEVGVGKTLSLATSAMVAALLGDGPVLILCPATLCLQWQVELNDKLGIPSAIWISNRKVWQDHNGNIIKTRGAEDIGRCPYRIGIVSTGLIFHQAEEASILLNRRYRTLILDEAHRARQSKGLGNKEGEPNNLLKFMIKAAQRSKHVVLGTATPIQTNVEELWDLLEVLNQGANHVLGQFLSHWKSCQTVLPILTKEKNVTNESEAWDLVRNPLPPKTEDALFDHIRSDLSIPDTRFYTDKSFTDLDLFTRVGFSERLESDEEGLSFFQRNNPIVRHTVLRKRATLENMGLLERIAVDIWPSEMERLPMFQGIALRTSTDFDGAYKAAEDFGDAMRRRTKAAGFMKDMMRQRICSSFASGLATAKKLLEKRQFPEDEEQASLIENFEVILSQEISHLERLIDFLDRKPADPKLKAVLHFLKDKKWLEYGCIIFSQYYDTSFWVAESLTNSLPDEKIALYAGAGKSGLFFAGEWRSVEREEIKRAVRDRIIRLVVATDAACEGLNLQTLGILINVDLPWNPSRLEQRIGRIKRFGQTRERVDMLNLVYQDTIDEKVYQVLSQRMKDRYNLFGSLPDTIEDEWIEHIENLDEYFSQFTQKKKQANAFDLRYASTVQPAGPGWELCETVLSRRDIIERLSEGW
ncbi:phospholipase D-like domain-containing anti-phage protein [Ktedonobacter robiniae]|nr:phospholipase D-like domain-containing anti-phage protein [Ktedonobacter robiniae]